MFNYNVIKRIIILMTAIMIIILCGCKPASISDPIPTMYKLTISFHNTSDFAYVVGVESALALLNESEKNIDFSQGIVIKESYFEIEREDSNRKEPYIIEIGYNSERKILFTDTFDVFTNSNKTLIFNEKLRLSCSDPVWAVYSDHPIKVYVEMVIYVFK